MNRSLTFGLALCIPAVFCNAAAPLHWYRCNTHTHTSARPDSDANETPAHIAEWYHSHGYQCLVITDHEYLTSVEPINRRYAADKSFLVLQGQEITQIVADPADPTVRRHLHVNAINSDRLIMPLGDPDPAHVPPVEAYRRNIEVIRAAGGIPQINHPNLQWSVRPGDLLPLDHPYLIEIWNAFSTSNNFGGTDDSGRISLSPEALWDVLLSRGKIVWAVASDDAHEYHEFDNREAPTPGKAWIVVQASDLTVPAIVEALRSGSFYASTGITLEANSVDRTRISIRIRQSSEWSPALTPSARYTTRFIGMNGRVLAELSGHSPQYRIKGDEGYVRASIVDSDGRKAWTQPLFLDGRKNTDARW